MKHLQVVCGVIKREEKYLIARRSNEKSNPGKWEFPGGKIEFNEDHVVALKRELFEELELIATDYHYLMDIEQEINGTIIRLIAYQCIFESGAEVSSDHDAIHWVNKHELSLYQFTLPDIPIREFIESRKEDF